MRSLATQDSPEAKKHNAAASSLCRRRPGGSPPRTCPRKVLGERRAGTTGQVRVSAWQPGWGQPAPDFKKGLPRHGTLRGELRKEARSSKAAGRLGAPARTPGGTPERQGGCPRKDRAPLHREASRGHRSGQETGPRWRGSWAICVGSMNRKWPLDASATVAATQRG